MEVWTICLSDYPFRIYFPDCIKIGINNGNKIPFRMGKTKKSDETAFSKLEKDSDFN